MEAHLKLTTGLVVLLVGGLLAWAVFQQPVGASKSVDHQAEYRAQRESERITYQEPILQAIAVGDVDAAVEKWNIYRKAQLPIRHDPEVEWQLSNLLVDKGRGSEAKPLIEELMNPTRVSSDYVSRGQTLLLWLKAAPSASPEEVQRVSSAWLDKIHKSEPSSRDDGMSAIAEAEDRTGRDLVAQTKFQEALPHLIRATELSPQSSLAQQDLGARLPIPGKPDGSKSSFHDRVSERETGAARLDQTIRRRLRYEQALISPQPASVWLPRGHQLVPGIVRRKGLMVA